MRVSAYTGSHPIPPMLLPFPLALRALSLISDAIFYFGGRKPRWETVAFYLAGGSVIGALAAVPGINFSVSLNLWLPS
jgi:uncharacterized membrane protein